ncbi:Golgi-associated plant pathogenesis-related protein 1-like, partial [Antedon mediterranea]|uniref:Golgi-associated plant pathogenesis-related protein 1-like n=1 Tax=Antedon mediterranea TaxID=105859 RepID=UPI003AF8F20A
MSKKDDLKKFQKESLEAHNDYRAAHGTPKLKLADDLNKIAQAYADQLAKTDSFRHSKRDGLGENLAMHFSSESTNYSGGEATQQWYSEIEKYNFDRCGFTPGTGHFTQVIWAETKELGVGKAITKSGKVLAVANYRPAGNMIGKFRENVLPLKKSRSVDLTKHSCTRRSSSSSSDDEQKSKK